MISRLIQTVRLTIKETYADPDFDAELFKVEEQMQQAQQQLGTGALGAALPAAPAPALVASTSTSPSPRTPEAVPAVVTKG
mgnify:CR=1 FL=1